MLKAYLQNRKEKKKQKKEEMKERRKEIGVFREYFELISETLIYVFFVMTFLLQSFVIPTESMVDTILVGDHLLVDKVAYSRSLGPLDKIVLPQTEIKRNMIVTFKSPAEMKKEYVKRVIGLPGDIIRISNQKIYINGKVFDDRFAKYRADYPENPMGERVTDKYKVRQIYRVEEGNLIADEYRWYTKGHIRLYRSALLIKEKIYREEIFEYDHKEKETEYDIEKLRMMPKKRVQFDENALDYAPFQFKEISYKWTKDNFPLPVNNLEFFMDFNARRDFSDHLIVQDGLYSFKVPEGHYFCIGDNRDHSYDSRFWGPVPEDYIIGKPWRIYWSYDADDYLDRGIKNKIKGLINTVLNFFSKTRWERTGMLVR